MKAVIMAGGKGSRLRPLTCQVPKPMVPLLNRPCMEYIIELLKSHGITEIAVTVQYLSEVIMNHFGDGSDFGVRLHYFEETKPMGTAGSVKNAEAFLDEPFLVISGDGLTDFNLTQAIQFHLLRKSLATLVLTKVNSPLEYGVVMIDPSGKVQRFLEKPSWSEVFSDTVNTGIYILQPEILHYIEKGAVYDFSMDLFPLLLNQERSLYGYVADGYWSDIGNLLQYRQTQFDMLDRKVKVRIAAREILPGIYLEESVHLPPKVKCTSPAYIGRNCTIGYGAAIGEYSVIGRNSVLCEDTSIERSILWDGIYVGENTDLVGATVCNQVAIGGVTSLCDGSVIGAHCSIGRKVVIRPNVKLWPSKIVLKNSTLHTSLIWGDQLSNSLFGSLGVLGIPNVDMTPEFASKLAAAYGSTLPPGSTIGISHSSHNFAKLMKTSFAMGLYSAGIHTLEFGCATTAAVRPCIPKFQLQGGIHFRTIQPLGEKRLLIEFMDHQGLPLAKGQERKIDNAYWQEDYIRSHMESTGENKRYDHAVADYLTALFKEVELNTIRQTKLNIVMQFDQQELGQLIFPWMQQLNCQLLSVPSHGLTATSEWLAGESDRHNDPSGKPGLQELSRMTANHQADLGVHMDLNGQNMTLITEDGVIVSEDMLLALKVMVILSRRKDTVIGIPVSAPQIIETIAANLEGRIIRTKETARSMMEADLAAETTVDGKARGMAGGAAGAMIFHPLFDDIYALSKIIEYLACERLTLTQALAQIPPFCMLREEVPCPWSEKGRIMRLMMNDTAGKPVELMDGIKIYNEDGWVLILPDLDEPSFQVIAQSQTINSARTLVYNYSQRILNSFEK